MSGHSLDISKISTIIFDVDGVLVDSESLSCGALNQILVEEIDIDIGIDYSEVIGTSNKDAIKFYLNKFGKELSNDEVMDLVDKKQLRYIELAKQSLTSFDNCELFISKLRDRNYKVAVASSGSIEKIKFSLGKVGLIHYFESLSSSEEVRNGKPAPDLFQLAINRQDAKPENCLVIEDSIFGIRAGKASGAYVAGFIGSFSKEQLLETCADLVVQSYSELIELFLL